MHSPGGIREARGGARQGMKPSLLALLQEPVLPAGCCRHWPVAQEHSGTWAPSLPAPSLCCPVCPRLSFQGFVSLSEILINQPQIFIQYLPVERELHWAGIFGVPLQCPNLGRAWPTEGAQ